MKLLLRAESYCPLMAAEGVRIGFEGYGHWLVHHAPVDAARLGEGGQPRL